MRAKRENGIALITVLLILLLVSGILAGMTWMVMSDQRLGGNNLNRDLAFYGAEAGMEKLTADMGNQFSVEGALTGSDVSTLEGTPPSMTGISFTNASGGNTYQILCGQPLADCTSPGAFTTSAPIIPPSPYAGMNATITPFTISVTASQAGGGEVKLHRQIQLVAIPVFQFGIYSDSDLAFFNGPQFNFGGRTHTNGNLWLAPNSGPLFLADKVTVAGQILRTNLENGYPGTSSTISSSTSYSGTVSIALTPNPSTLPSSSGSGSYGPYNNAQWRTLGLNESSVSGPSVYGNVSTTPNAPGDNGATWNNIEKQYNGMVINGVAPLSLTSTALGGLTQPITLIRRPTVGEKAANPALFSQQYFSQGTLRILLDDYPSGVAPGSSNACHSSPLMSLDGIDTATDPFDLATLAGNSASAPAWWSGTETFYPLPTAHPSGSSYSSTTGYWETDGSPIITGCLKVEYQDANATTPAWHDITKTILSQGYIGRNINPHAYCSSCTVAPTMVTLPGTGTQVAPQGPASGVTTVGCTDPNPNAIIRFARLRDNPSNANHGGCGTATNHGYDYWPNALFDTREGVFRDNIPVTNTVDGNPEITTGGVMYYVELDAANLANWIRNNRTAVTGNLNNSTGFAVYFSDRRSEQADDKLATPTLTGSYGYNDFVNPTDVNHGCPNGGTTPDTGEDIEGDGKLRTYGANWALPYSTLRFSSDIFTPSSTSVIMANPNCGAIPSVPVTGVWPGLVFRHTQEARQNAPVFFRRALKIVDGQTLNLGTSCFTGGTPACGLTISAENPVYLMGDYNVPGLSMTSSSSVATSIAGDAVTLLSDNWNDVNSFISPYDAGSRGSVDTLYRVALIGGKGIPFPQIGSTEDFGTDGGVHNFLRFLENWGSQHCYYGGSLVSFYYYHQAVGTYKGGPVYSPPSRIYNYDTNFSQGTQYLPPLTPRLRAINTIGFTQEINPTQ